MNVDVSQASSVLFQFQSYLYVSEHSLNNLVRPFIGFQLAYLIKTESTDIPHR